MSYLTDHPTSFVWEPAVKKRVRAVQIRRPWMTYINTYWDHPPDFQVPRRWAPGYYDAVSFDVWGGGLTLSGKYTGYRGKPLPRERGNKILEQLMNAKTGPEIDWIIWNWRMWWNPETGGLGWTAAPPGPADSDPNHVNHLHVTYRR